MSSGQTNVKDIAQAPVGYKFATKQLPYRGYVVQYTDEKRETDEVATPSSEILLP